MKNPHNRDDHPEGATGAQQHSETCRTSGVYRINLDDAGTFEEVMSHAAGDWTQVSELTVSGHLNKVDMACLARLTNLAKLDLSQTDIKSIGGCQRLSQLHTVILPDTVEVIEEYAFFVCGSLATIKLPRTLKVIAKHAFSETSLKVAAVPEGVTLIQDGAFAGCPLEAIFLPSTIEKIESNGNPTFSCDWPPEYNKISDIYCKSIIPPVGLLEVNVLPHPQQRITLHVPAMSLDAYKKHCPRYIDVRALEGDAAPSEIDTIELTGEFTLDDFSALCCAPDLIIGSDFRHAKVTINGSETLTLNKFVMHQELCRFCIDVKSISDNRVLYSIPTADILFTKSNVSAKSVTTKIKLPLGSWTLVSFPYDVLTADVLAPEGFDLELWQYIGQTPGKKWRNVGSGETLNAYTGYLIRCTRPSGLYEENEKIEIEFPAVDNERKNNIFRYDNVAIPLAAPTSSLEATWHLIGNPYPTYLSNKQLGFEALVAMWDGNGFTIRSTVSDDFIIFPNEAFFVQCAPGTQEIIIPSGSRCHDLNSQQQLIAPAAHNTRTATCFDFGILVPK